MKQQHMTSIYLIPDVVIEGSEYERHSQMHRGGSHDGINQMWPIALPDAVNPILAEEFKDSEGEKLTPDALFFEVAKLLFSEDRTRPIHLYQGSLNYFHTKPPWTLWCGQQETKEELAVQYLDFFGTPLDLGPTLDELKAQVRTDIKTAILAT